MSAVTYHPTFNFFGVTTNGENNSPHNPDYRRKKTPYHPRKDKNSKIKHKKKKTNSKEERTFLTIGGKKTPYHPFGKTKNIKNKNY